MEEPQTVMLPQVVPLISTAVWSFSVTYLIVSLCVIPFRFFSHGIFVIVLDEVKLPHKSFLQQQKPPRGVRAPLFLEIKKSYISYITTI